MTSLTSGHRLVGGPVAVDYGCEAECQCGFSSWGHDSVTALDALFSHLDQVALAVAADRYWGAS